MQALFSSHMWPRLIAPVGGALLFIGVFLPWISFCFPYIGCSSQSGIQTSGWIGAAGIFCGLMSMGALFRTQARTAGLADVVVGSLALLAFLIVFVPSWVAGNLRDALTLGFTIGVGVYVYMLGGVAVVVGGVLNLFHHRSGEWKRKRSALRALKKPESWRQLETLRKLKVLDNWRRLQDWEKLKRWAYLKKVSNWHRLANASPLEKLALMEIRALALINVERSKHGLPPMKWDESLHWGVRKHSQRMQKLGALFHDVEELRKLNCAECCYGASHASSSHFSAESAVRSWMFSKEGHRETLLGEGYAYGAVGIAKQPGFFATYRCY